MHEWLLAEFHWLFVMGLLVLMIAGCLVAHVRAEHVRRDDDKQGRKYYRTSVRDHRRWVAADDAGWIDGSWRWKWQARLEARKWTVINDPPEYAPDDETDLPPIEEEPGDEWADELHNIGQDIAAEPAWSWRAEVMHRWKPVLALGQVTEEDVARFYLEDGDYWALRRSEMRSWQAGNDEDEKRYLRSCVRRGWLVMEDLAA